jgi:hypothetical protein
MNSLLLINSLYENLNNSVSVKLTDSEVNFIEELITKYPNILNQIKDQIDNIISDEKIDLHDIPQIILLISNIYTSHIFEKSIENIEIINIVKFTLDSLIDSSVLPLPNIKKEIIKKTIDSSISLLNFNITTIFKKEKICCYNFL